ncbi:zinc-ribbon domain-containing protein [Desulfosporosinus sp. SB140]
MDQLKSCKTCSKEVAKSATVCPHCGALLRGA